MEASFQNPDDVGVLCGGCHSFLVVDLAVDVDFLDVGAGGDLDCGFHGGGQIIQQFNFDHESYNLGHGAVGDGGGVVNLHKLVVGDAYAIEADNSQLLESEGVFWIIDESDQLEYL